jgi:hypothetical protein
MIKQFLNRAAAGIATAGLTGTVAGVLISLYAVLSAGPTGPNADLRDSSETMIVMSTVYGAILGAPFGILVVCLSRAKAAPWRSLPTLLAGTSIGIVVLGLPWALLPFANDNPIIIYVMFIAGPTIGGIVAANFIPGQALT